MQKPTHRNICEGRCWGWENLNFCYWITGGSIWTGDSLLAQNLPSTQDTQVQSLSYKDPLAKGMATPSSILAWKIPWTEETGRLQSVAKSYRGCKESDRTERLTYNVDKLKTVGGQSWVSFTSWRFYQLVSIREKSPHAFGRERGKRTILKHGACCLFQQVLPWRETYPKPYLLGYYQRLTNLGEKTLLSYPILSKEGGGEENWEAVKFTVHRLTKRLRPNHRKKVKVKFFSCVQFFAIP